MTLAKVKEQDGMMLAKVKEQDGMMLANIKVPSIPTSAACCDDVQLTDAESSSYTFTTVNYLIRLRPPNTDISSYLSTIYFIGLRPPKQIPLVIYNRQLLRRTASSKTQTPLVIYNCQPLHRTASSFKPLM